MNKLKTILAVSVLILLVNIPSFAQSPMTLQLGGGLGYVSPMGNYGGSTMDYYAGTKYGLSSGINIHGKARLEFLGFNLNGEIGYTWLSNSGNSEPGQGSINISQKVFSIKVGPEIQFKIPLSPITPYLGANISLNSFSGDASFQGVAKIPSADYAMQNAVRVGLGLGGGIILGISRNMNLDIGIQYNFLNVFGKSWNNANAASDQRLNSYLALNDAADPNYINDSNVNFINSSRSINTLSISATLMFVL